MKNTGIFYGSATGYTADAATRIAKALGVPLSDVHDVAQSSPSMLSAYDVLVFGSSTWGSGEVTDSWYDFLDGIEGLDLSDKTIALFALGDETMSDTFCGAAGVLYDRLKATGAKFIGSFNTDGYDYRHSPAVREGRAVGLLLDDVNHADLTDSRIDAWAAQLKKEI